MISPEKAFRIVVRHVRPLESVQMSSERALGFCLAEEVRADRDMPPADRSAMDGYAVRASDLSSTPRIRALVGEVAAGSSARPRVRPGTCVRILTGANVPPGADTVVKIEQTQGNNGVVTFQAPVQRGANILRRGEDAGRKTVLLRKGAVLTSPQIGICAAVRKTEVRVHRHPRVAILCTGEELRNVREKVRSHESRNSNGPALCAALVDRGYDNVTQGVSPDNRELLSSKLKGMLAKYDMVLLTGGVSVGKYDFVPEAVERVGATVRFHGVTMKPGKPLLYATFGDNRHIFGLPGNPLSSMTGFHEFALPALRRLSGFSVKDCRPSLYLPLASSVTRKGERTWLVLARLLQQADGTRAMPLKSHSSADLAAGGRADGVVVVPTPVRCIEAGSVVEFRPWRSLS